MTTRFCISVRGLSHRFNIHHATLQVEAQAAMPAKLAPAGVV